MKIYFKVYFYETQKVSYKSSVEYAKKNFNDSILHNL